MVVPPAGLGYGRSALGWLTSQQNAASGNGEAARVAGESRLFGPAPSFLLEEGYLGIAEGPTAHIRI